jgi:hypothetical protein
MRFQDLIFILCAFILQLVTLTNGYSSDEPKRCFTFDKKILKPIADFDLKELTEKSSTASGVFAKNQNKMVWAKVIDVLPIPINKVYQLLLDHTTTISPKIDELKVETENKKEFDVFHKVHLMLNPFLFVKIRWQENWAYSILEGDISSPQKVLISYEKVDGTHYISHLCGSIVLEKKSDSATFIYQYEEAIAENRTAQNTYDGLLGTLKTLRDRNK